jgi:hypothetical protein
VIDVGMQVWAVRDGKSVRAKVMARPTATRAVLRDRKGLEWEAPIEGLTPCVSGPEGQSALTEQRERIAKARGHLNAARRIMGSDER